MKVLSVLESLKPGGVRERAYQLSRALEQAGHSASMIVPADQPDLSWMDPSTAAHVIAVPFISRRYPIPYGLRVIWKSVRDADVIHMMSHWSMLHAIAYVAARFYRKPFVICPAGALRIYGRSQLLKVAYNLLAGNRIVRNAARAIAITPDERRTLESYGASPERTVVVPNAVAIDDFSATAGGFRQSRNLDPGFILFLGRLNSIKGPDLLLRAFLSVADRLDGLHLVLAGPDEGLLGMLKNLAAGHPRVHLVGPLKGGEKISALTDATFVAIPSRHEAMSIVVLEAGACGTAALVTDQCGFPEVEENGGGLVVPATVEGIAEGLVRMTELVRTAAAGEKLRALVEQHYSWTASVQAHLKIFGDVIGRPDAAAGIETK
jgi:glycosyltransferase involved in cell wall biosynthesis